MAWTRTSLRFACFGFFFNSPLSAGVVGVFFYISFKCICCCFLSRRFSAICLLRLCLYDLGYVFIYAVRGLQPNQRSELKKLALLSESGYATLLLDENRL